MNLQRIAILAPGLLGGSLALAIRERHPHVALSIFARRDSAIEEMRSSGLKAHYFTNPSEAVHDADLVIFCMTVGAMASIAQQIQSSLKPQAIVTDVGSVKEVVDHEMQAALGNSARWIGSHPMAGGEKTGFSAAQANLFDSATTILTPTEHSNSEALRILSEFWKSLGSTIVICSPQEHDRRVAQISHLTHLTSSALVRAVSSESILVRGPGFRDTTRVAAGPPEMWTEILLQNKKAVLESITSLQKEISTIQKHLQDSNAEGIKEWLSGSSEIRSKL
ncbi:MAG: prephenate dehydrogenase/arogenate dehydrogenase family protein [Verrucomicrobiota bacterium]